MSPEGVGGQNPSTGARRCMVCCFLKLDVNTVPGGQLPYETDGDARHLA